MEEIWKKAISSRFPDLVVDLEVSDSGKVRKQLTKKEYIGQNSKGYLTIARKLGNNPSKDLYIHTLVAETFIGPRIEDAVIDHKNGHKTDNRAVNLQYLTRAENSSKGVKVKTITDTNYNEERKLALERFLLMLNKISSIIDQL